MEALIGYSGIVSAGVALVFGVPILAARIAGVPIPDTIVATPLAQLALWSVGMIALARTHKLPKPPQ